MWIYLHTLGNRIITPTTPRLVVRDLVLFSPSLRCWSLTCPAIPITMSVVNADSGTSTILLRPRPFALRSGSFLLLPLLPEKEVAKHLPSEIWTQILYYAITQYNQHEKHLSDNYRLGLLLISKTLKVRKIPESMTSHSHCLSGRRLAVVLQRCPYHKPRIPEAVYRPSPRCRPEVGLDSSNTLLGTWSVGAYT